MGLGPKKPSISRGKTFTTYNLQNIILSLPYMGLELPYSWAKSRVVGGTLYWQWKQNGYMGRSGWLWMCWWFTLGDRWTGQEPPPHGIMGHTWGSHLTLLAPERAKFKIQSMVSIECTIALLHHCKVKKSHHRKSGILRSPFLSILSYRHYALSEEYKGELSPVFAVQGM